MSVHKLLAGTLVVLACIASAVRAPLDRPFGAAHVALDDLAYFPGSAIALTFDGLSGRYDVGVLGDGETQTRLYRISPQATPGTVTLVAGNADAAAMQALHIVAAPTFDRPLLAVASYDTGIVLHDPSAAFSLLGVLGIGGPAGDVAIDGARIAAVNTGGTTMTTASTAPWRVQQIDGVAFGNEIAFDPRTHAAFVSNRDVDGHGALTRITAEGNVTRTMLGDTSEGVAVDSTHHRVFVANVNDGTISVVDADTMIERARFFAVARAFSLTLSPDATHLYVVSNQSADSPFNAAGSVVAFDVHGTAHRVIARSARLDFPLGVALDARHGRLYVTDEDADAVDVLDPVTLHALRAPLATCETPWTPMIDTQHDRLYIPCARANRIDVFDTTTLRRTHGAPFATGGYPLAVALWNPVTSTT